MEISLSDNFQKFSGLKDKLAKVKYKIKIQQEEMKKTEFILDHFKSCYNKQRKTLNLYLSEESSLVAEHRKLESIICGKESKCESRQQELLKRRISENDYERNKKIRCIEHERNHKYRYTRKKSSYERHGDLHSSSDDPSHSLVKITRFAEELESCQRILNNILLFSESGDKSFNSQQFIPNSLKSSNVSERKFLIFTFQEKNLKNSIRTLCKCSTIDSESVSDIRLFLAKGRLSYIESYNSINEDPQYFYLKAPQTILIHSEVWFEGDCHIETESTPVIVGFEVNLKGIELQSNKIPGITRYPMPPSSILERNGSFVRCYPVDEESIVFFGASYGMAKDEFVLLDVVILNFEGIIIYQQKSCPRKYITDFHTDIHGVTSLSVIGQTDQESVCRQLQYHLRGAVVVGFDVQRFLLSASVPFDFVLGMRDLCRQFHETGYKYVDMEYVVGKYLGRSKCRDKFLVADRIADYAFKVYSRICKQQPWNDAWFPLTNTSEPILIDDDSDDYDIVNKHDAVSKDRSVEILDVNYRDSRRTCSSFKSNSKRSYREMRVVDEIND